MLRGECRMMSEIEVLTQLKKDVEKKRCKDCGGNLTFRGVSLDSTAKGAEVGEINCYCEACGTEAKLKVHIKI